MLCNGYAKFLLKKLESDFCFSKSFWHFQRLLYYLLTGSRQPHNHLVFIAEIPVPEKDSLYIEIGPRIPW